MLRLTLATSSDDLGKATIAIHLVEESDIAEAALMVRIRVPANVVAAAAELTRVVAFLNLLTIGVAEFSTIQDVPDLVHDLEEL